MLNEQFKRLEKIFESKNQKEMCNFFSTELVDTDAPEYIEIKKYEPYSFIEQIHKARLSSQYISFTYIYCPWQDYTIYGYKDIIDILELQDPFVFEVAIHKKDFNEQRLISMIIFSNHLKMNMYTSMSDYKGVRRNSSNLYGSRMINIDLDVYNTIYENYEDDELLMEMQPYFDKVGIQPSVYINSGHGKYISFILDSNINLKLSSMKDLYQNVCKKMIDLLSPFGADKKCSDPTHVFRVPGSLNMKTNEQAYIVFLDESKTTNISMLAERLGIPKVKKEKKTLKKSKKKYTTSKTMAKSKYSKVNEQRHEDLLQYLEMRNYDIEGHRDLFFHIMSVNCFYMGMPEEEVYSIIDDLNNQLKNPLSTIKPIVKYAKENFNKYLEDETKAVKYTNKDIVALLDITPGEQKEMFQFIEQNELEIRRQESISQYNIGVKEKLKTITKEKKEKLIEEMNAYRLKYLATNKQIAQYFVIDERTVTNLIGKEPKYVTIGLMTKEKLVLYYSNLHYSINQISTILGISERMIRKYRNRYTKIDGVYQF